MSNVYNLTFILLQHNFQYTYILPPSMLGLCEETGLRISSRVALLVLFGFPLETITLSALFRIKILRRSTEFSASILKKKHISRFTGQLEKGFIWTKLVLQHLTGSPPRITGEVRGDHCSHRSCWPVIGLSVDLWVKLRPDDWCHFNALSCLHHYLLSAFWTMYSTLSCNLFLLQLILSQRLFYFINLP